MTRLHLICKYTPQRILPPLTIHFTRKQRREIGGGTAFYEDQCVVRAAIHGRILLLDGLEKAERNVLPVINNLMENREMSLSDGFFLVSPQRYDELLETFSEQELLDQKLLRVSDEFRVMALALPVPQYVGYPMDPPLRSRFQGHFGESSKS